MKLLLFGTGRFYQRRRDVLRKIMEDDVVIGFVDNRAVDIGMFEGKPVLLPEQIKDVPFDCIVLMSVSSMEMRDQLLELGIPNGKIYFWEAYQARKAELVRKDFFRTPPSRSCECIGKVFIVSVFLSLNGGTLAIGYAAEELVRRGYDVTLAVPGGDEGVIQDLQSKGADIIVIPGLMYCDVRYLLRSHYDVVLVNVFQNIRLACLFSKYVPTLWWIHEPSARYASMLYPFYQKLFPEFDTTEWMKRVHIATVTQMAREIFEAYYPEQVNATLLLGEESPKNISFERRRIQPIRVAVLGVVMERKGQDIFLEAVRKMSAIRQPAEFWLIGYQNDASAFGQHVAALAKGIQHVRFCGPIARAELMELFPTLDVIVCASREETLSMAIVEGMMHGKVCITTDATGIAEMIEDGKNGYIVPVEDVDALSKCMEDVIEHYDDLGAMRHAARETYETYFTMEAFGDRLEREIEITMQEWKARSRGGNPDHDESR